MTEHLTAQQRIELAAWYWTAIDEAWTEAITEDPVDLTGGKRVQDLISAAICEGLIGLPVDIGDGVKVPLSTLVAPFRTRPGGLAETSAAERSRVLGEGMQRKRVWW